MSKNIVKANFIQLSADNVKVIDSNSLVAKRLEGYTGVLREPAYEPEDNVDIDEGGLDESTMNELLADVDENGEPLLDNEEGFSEINFAETAENISEAVEETLEDARRQAEEIINEATRQAEGIKAEAFRAGEEEGYNEGHERAVKECEMIKNEVLEYKKSLEEEYERMSRDMEPKLVDAITKVYRKVFSENFYNNDAVVVYLIHNALMHTESDSRILIHVSEDDYETVLAAKDEIFSHMTLHELPTIDIDAGLSKGQAKIETSHGMLDCSIDTQLKELERTVRLVSYEDNYDD